MRAVLQSSGQNCAGAERFYVHEDIYSSFVSQVSKIVKSVTAVSMPLHHVCYYKEDESNYLLFKIHDSFIYLIF